MSSVITNPKVTLEQGKVGCWKGAGAAEAHDKRKRRQKCQSSKLFSAVMNPPGSIIWENDSAVTDPRLHGQIQRKFVVKSIALAGGRGGVWFVTEKALVLHTSYSPVLLLSAPLKHINTKAL